MAASADGNMSQTVIDTAVKERERLHTGRSRTSTMVVLGLLAAAGLFAALVLGKADPNTPPDCDGHTMTHTSLCQIISNRGGGGTFSYSEMIDRRESSKEIWRYVGFGTTGVMLVSMVFAFTKLDPNRPWGTAVPAACPRCYQPTLREKLTVHSVTRGRTTYRYSGIVTLCTPVCGFRTIRQR
ncbi:hypothetical protein [Streptomyces rubellomurinus]|uniref:Uncharacterized protein n=2 Tax=Streptomyces TaxID=1883 RepID=A0A0F2TAN2_STRR3|nr:hypothetical protein [Streptomyces rubellomurinus]KJS59491.1 hypothetical protein VM95_26950 [Streptomyces rubellomurinus]